MNTEMKITGGTPVPWKNLSTCAVEDFDFTILVFDEDGVGFVDE